MRRVGLLLFVLCIVCYAALGIGYGTPGLAWITQAQVFEQPDGTVVLCYHDIVRCETYKRYAWFKQVLYVDDGCIIFDTPERLYWYGPPIYYEK